MKIEVHSNVKLPLNKTTEIPNMTIVVRGAFQENYKYDPQGFLGEYL